MTWQRVRCVACGVYPRACGGTGSRTTKRVFSREPVYPRACGGTPICRSIVPTVIPRSIPAPAGEPESWGQLGRPNLRRSIPAPAGEPPAAKRGQWRKRVYPRACGGTTGQHGRAKERSGLSPRLRGNPIADDRGNCLRHTVYPRACGGTRKAPQCWPRTAHRVYPRACGGTGFRRLYRCFSSGLSPRLRGNLQGSQAGRVRQRSIPAPAGEPTELAGIRDAAKVYPRACGGTLSGLASVGSSAGLSPRLRGNLMEIAPCRVLRWSIPAPAGEPRRA